MIFGWRIDLKNRLSREKNYRSASANVMRQADMASVRLRRNVPGMQVVREVVRSPAWSLSVAPH